MNLMKPLLIFSVHQPNKSKGENALRHAAVALQLVRDGIPYLETEGGWLGLTQYGFLLSVEHRDRVEQLCLHYEQADYVEVDANGQAYMMVPGENGFKYFQELGRLQQSVDRPIGKPSLMVGGSFVSFGGGR